MALLEVADLRTSFATEDGTVRAVDGVSFTLKPGRVLGIEYHRLPETQDAERERQSGYMKVSTIRKLAEEAGFLYDKTSEINANPKDTKDHPFGVWTLPPVRRSSPRGQPEDPTFDHTKYDAIGESDRMTLRLLKPT